MRQSGQPCLSITVSVMISSQPFTQRIHPFFFLGPLNSLSPLALLSSSSSILSASAFSKTGSYLLNFFPDFPLSAAWLVPGGTDMSCVAMLRFNETGTSSSASLSRRDTGFISPRVILSVSAWDRLCTCPVKIRSGPKGHSCLGFTVRCS